MQENFGHKMRGAPLMTALKSHCDIHPSEKSVYRLVGSPAKLAFAGIQTNFTVTHFYVMRYDVMTECNHPRNIRDPMEVIVIHFGLKGWTPMKIAGCLTSAIRKNRMNLK